MQPQNSGLFLRRLHRRAPLQFFQKWPQRGGPPVRRAQHNGPGPRSPAFQFVRRSVGHDASAVDDDGPRAHHLHFLEDVGGKNDRFVFAHPPDERTHLMLLVRIESIGRLVEDQHRRIMQNGLRQTGAVTVTLRQRVDALVNDRLEKTRGDGALHGILELATAQAARLAAKPEKPGNGHVAVARRILRQVSDQPLGFHRLLFDIEVAHLGRTGGWREETGDDPHGRRLAGAVGSEKTEDFPLVDTKGHPVYRGFGTEIFLQIID